ncbi:uncharacterized protein LOC109285302 isoform X3 [Alligator mississippiensis]|uniref:uncharacterized protein LOC109285302 isoform X3 n=1 Tax=Alligator mississippiensis TaxID=8496 RepID=UPI0028778A83|nr:uncharacterized protein LOC109285302 isoform X3 [Alligator mississippiensis]
MDSPGPRSDAGDRGAGDAGREGREPRRCALPRRLLLSAAPRPELPEHRRAPGGRDLRAWGSGRGRARSPRPGAAVAALRSGSSWCRTGNTDLPCLPQHFSLPRLRSHRASGLLRCPTSSAPLLLQARNE